MPPRYPPRTANPNRITLDLDPITADALKQAAQARKVDRLRLVYELIQRGLGISTTAPTSEPQPADVLGDPMGAALRRLTPPA